MTEHLQALASESSANSSGGASSLQTPEASAADYLLRTVVIIPARNEEASISLVLRDLPEVGAVLVVDNGSTDRTAVRAREFGAIVIEERRPGYGQACLAGLEALRELAPGLGLAPDYVAFLDGDYSDHPSLLPQLVEPVHSGEYDFVLGSRLLGMREEGAMPAQSVFGNKLAVSLIQVFWGHRYNRSRPVPRHTPRVSGRTRHVGYQFWLDGRDANQSRKGWSARPGNPCAVSPSDREEQNQWHTRRHDSGWL